MEFIIDTGTYTNIKLNYQLRTGIVQETNDPQPSTQYVRPRPETINPVQETYYIRPPQQSIPITRPTTPPPFIYNERPQSIPTSISNHNNPSDDSICGHVSTATSLIKGGSKYRKGDWPWLAALFYNNEFYCGGSISKSKTFLSL